MYKDRFLYRSVLSWTWTITRLMLILLGGAFALSYAAVAVGQAAIFSGGLIAFASTQTGNWDIYLMDVRREVSLNLTRHPANDLGPVWSPQTQQLAFYSDRDVDGSTGIYVISLSDGAVQPIAAGLSNYWRPHWSPDGRQLVFTHNYGELRIMDAAGTNERGLVYGFGPVWSPTEPRIAFYADSPGELNAEVYLIDADGRNLRNLTQNPAHDWDPAWSSDGQEIAFVSMRDGNAEIYVVDASCLSRCAVRRLTYNSITDSAPVWSPDKTRIAFESVQDGSGQIVVMNADGSNAYAVTKSTINSRSPVWLDK